MAVFAVTMVNGPAFDPRRGRREQAGWDEHAACMDRLVDAGTIILGGPIGDDTLLAVEATDEEAVRAAFAADPWHADGTLHIGRIQPWQLWLDSRPAADATTGSSRATGAGREQTTRWPGSGP